MAIYHLSTNVHSRGKGHSAVSAAAYRSGERLYDERLGQTYDWQQYRKSHGEVLASEIFLPEGADEKYLDRETLWNGAEAAEKTKAGEYKKTAAVAREIEASLPHELSDSERRDLARIHAEKLVKRYGVAVDMNIHAPHPEGSEKNYHVHYLLTTRKLGEHGFGEKCELELDGKTKKKLGFATGKEQIKEIRKSWAEDVNRELERGGHAERVDARSYSERGIAKSASQHLGPAATAMERKGEKTRIGEKNRRIEKENEVWDRDRADLERQEKIIDLAIEKEKRRIEQERRERQAEKEIRADAREIRKMGSFAEELDRVREFDEAQHRKRDALEQRLKQFYNREETVEQLQEARERAERSNTFWGRLTGQHHAALEDVTAYQKNLASIEQLQKEQRDALERQLWAERMQRERPQAPEPQKAPEAVPRFRSAREMVEHFERSTKANDNQPEPSPQQNKGRDRGGYER